MEKSPEQAAQIAQAIQAVQRFIPFEVRSAVDRIMASSSMFSKSPDRDTALNYAAEINKGCRMIRNMAGKRSESVESLYQAASSLSAVVGDIAKTFALGDDDPDKDATMNALGDELTEAQGAISEAMKAITSAAATAAKASADAENGGVN